MKKYLNKGVISFKIILIVIIILIIGVIAWKYIGNSEEGVKEVEIPEACLSYKDDICGLFGCMVDLCWCVPGPEAVLFESGEEITNEQVAIDIVQQYLQNSDLEYRAVRLNDFFFNVLTTDQQGNEDVFTVGADGTIISTMCGV